MHQKNIFGILLGVIFLCPVVFESQTASAQVLPQAGICSSNGFNLIALERANLANSDSDAPILAKQLSFTSYGVSSQKRGSTIGYSAIFDSGNFQNGQFYGPIAGNTISTSQNVTVFNSAGQSAQLSTVLNNPAYVTSPYAYDFSSLTTCLQNCTSGFSQSLITGKATSSYGTLTLSRLDPLASQAEYTFSITAATLDATSSVVIEQAILNQHARVVVNVSGTSARFDNMGFSGNIDSTKVLWNFFEAGSLEISSIGVKGTVLAPIADVIFKNGNIDGALIARNVIGDSSTNNVATGETHFFPYAGSCALTTPSPVLECVARNAATSYQSYWGYLNLSGSNLTVPVGNNNQFSPAPANRNQPTTFKPGSADFVVDVGFSSGSMSWTLPGGTKSATTEPALRCEPSCIVPEKLNLSQCDSTVMINGAQSGTLNNNSSLSSFSWTTTCDGVLTNTNTLRPTLTLNQSAFNPSRVSRCEVQLTVVDDTRFGSSDASELQQASCETTIKLPPCKVDCAGIPNGSTEVDECGVCGGDGSSCLDCSGVPNGGLVIDQCGVCGGNNESCKDCSGVPNGGAVIDGCGVCGGDGSSCASSCSAEIDQCGVCDGDNTSCADCAGIPNGGTKVDACGVCGGDGSSCSECIIPSLPGLAEDAIRAKLKKLLKELATNTARYVREARQCGAQAKREFSIITKQVGLAGSNSNLILRDKADFSLDDTCFADHCTLANIEAEKQAVGKIAASLTKASIAAQRAVAKCRAPLPGNNKAQARQLLAMIEAIIKKLPNVILKCE